MVFNQQKYEQALDLNLLSAIEFIYISPKDLLDLWFKIDFYLTKRYQFLEKGDAY